MTTLVALATRDALVMGCDSLGTVTRELVDPFDLIKQFFDPENEWKLKTDEQGKPILEKFDQIYKKAQTIPFNQMTHVTKIFSLDPLPMGVMITGIESIKNRTIKSLIGEFKKEELKLGKKIPSRMGDYTVKIIAKRLLDFISQYYNEQYAEWKSKPYLELMIGGYNKAGPFPSIFKILITDTKIEDTFPEDDPFGIVFGGQMQEIQRLVFGTDGLNKAKIAIRFAQLFEKYRLLLREFLGSKGISEELPSADNFIDELNPFDEWDLDGFDANWADFSEQNAIECVNFFVEIMAKSQQFSSRLPTVGGDIHIGLITKDKGFKFISRQEYVHEGYVTPMED